MGSEAQCTARVKGRTVAGKARLETEVLEFRGADLKLSIPFKSVRTISVSGDALNIDHTEGRVTLDVGANASRWAEKILHPPSRAQKLGVKPGWTASAIGVDDEQFLKELKKSVAFLSIGRAIKGNDAIFFSATREADLRQLEKLKTMIKPDGAIWVIRPKGRPEISERAVMAAGKAAGLVDVKVVGFSQTHTAEKLVIPVAQRKR
jgi:hypothetical protein